MRYRVHFVAFFEREIDASDDHEAREVADTHCTIARLPEGAVCRWRACELIGNGGDDD